MNSDPLSEAQEFLKISSEFNLGNLTTEKINPLSRNLSSLAQNNISEALTIIKKIDQEALDAILNKKNEIYEFYLTVKKQLASGNKIFLCGCGATGRLSIALETIFRKKYQTNQVIGFMAGGDFAYIKSVESFEDRMSYGVRQLTELGFTDKDLVIGITEGGETSFVIGATIHAAQVSQHKPYFLYCNPDDVLMPIKRSQDVITHQNISKLNLTCGPMALSGSTRMQATTVQMLVMGVALMFDNKISKEKFYIELETVVNELKNLSYDFLSSYIKNEADHYKKGGIVTYQTSEDLAVSILTDTTERSPTFSLMSFEKNDEKHLALCYLSLELTKNSEEAWEKMLGRAPRGLNWELETVKIDNKEIYKFDISENAIHRRAKKNNHQVFKVLLKNNFIFDFLGEKMEIPKSQFDLMNHLRIKLWLNAHSTIVMGRMERYQDNVMTFVRTSNNKLIDRACRYAQELLKNRGKLVSYEEIVKTLFLLKPQMKPEDSIVLTIVQYYLNA
jgi:N-acetylmuramic acid 6-phosphate etherase